MYISKLSYQLSNGLSYNVNKDHKKRSLEKGINNLIPIISFSSNYKKYKETRALHKKWHSQNKLEYFYDVRFSKIRSATYLCNALGIGLLIMPFRILATVVKSFNEHTGRKCKNPHLLRGHPYAVAKFYNKNIGMIIGKQLEYFPKEAVHIAKMHIRDHVQDPYIILDSLYPDPLKTQADIDAQARIDKINDKRPSIIDSPSEEIRKRKERFNKRKEERNAAQSKPTE